METSHLSDLESRPRSGSFGKIAKNAARFLGRNFKLSKKPEKDPVFKQFEVLFEEKKQFIESNIQLLDGNEIRNVQIGNYVRKIKQAKIEISSFWNQIDNSQLEKMQADYTNIIKTANTAYETYYAAQFENIDHYLNAKVEKFNKKKNIELDSLENQIKELILNHSYKKDEIELKLKELEKFHAELEQKNQKMLNVAGKLTTSDKSEISEDDPNETIQLTSNRSKKILTFFKKFKSKIYDQDNPYTNRYTNKAKAQNYLADLEQDPSNVVTLTKINFLLADEKRHIKSAFSKAGLGSYDEKESIFTFSNKCSFDDNQKNFVMDYFLSTSNFITTKTNQLIPSSSNQKNEVE